MAETEDLKSFQYRFESDRGHRYVRKSSHEAAIDSIIQIVNAYTMHTHCPKDSKAMIRCSQTFLVIKVTHARFIHIARRIELTW